MSLKKGEVVTAEAVRLDFPNRALMETEDGETFTAKNVLPGQSVRCRITKVRAKKAEGTPMEIIRRSFHETESKVCPHFGACGGCLYQSVPYEEELRLKEAQMVRLFRDVEGGAPAAGEADSVLTGTAPGWFDAAWEGITPSPESTAYRNKMEFSFGDEYKDGPLSLGMHRRGSFYDVVTVSDCRIIDRDMRTVLQTTLDFFAKRNVTYRHKMTQEGYLRHLLVRKAKKTGELLVDLVHSGELSSSAFGGGSEAADESGGITAGRATREETLLTAWRDALLSQDYDGRIAGILHTKNDRVADVIADEGTEVLFGTPYFYEELLGLRFRITPFSFFQTNSRGAEALYSIVRNYVTGTDEAEQNSESAAPETRGEKMPAEDHALHDKVIYDLYSGTGTIAQVIAPVAKKVIGIEIVEEAVSAARENAKENHLENCEFYAGDVLKVLTDENTPLERPDIIILDPPRDGVHPKALTKILSYGVETLLYISCKPTSLARDLPVMFEHGYRVQRMRAVEMYPRTANVEVICKLQK